MLHACPMNIPLHTYLHAASFPLDWSDLKKVQLGYALSVLMTAISESLRQAGYRFSGAAAPCSAVQGMYKLHAAVFPLLPQY